MSRQIVLNRGGGGKDSSIAAGKVPQNKEALVNGILALNLGDTDAALWSGTNGGFGNTQCNLFYPAADALVSDMGYYCTQASGVVGSGVKMGIYEGVTGDLIAETNIVPAAVGGQFLPLVAPVTLLKSKAYYLALSCNENGARFIISSGKWAGAGSPSISFEIPNEMVPANALVHYSNKTSVRYTIGAF